MSENFQNDPDIEEIFRHIRQLIKSRDQFEDIKELQQDTIKNSMVNTEEITEETKIKTDISKPVAEQPFESETPTHNVTPKVEIISTQEPTDVEHINNESSAMSHEVIDEEFTQIDVEPIIPLSEEQSDISETAEISNLTNTVEKNDLVVEEEVFSRVTTPDLSRWGEDSITTCDLCNSKIVLGKHLSGLVVEDKFFACEECCQTQPKMNLMNWTKSRMKSSNSVRPIGLWLTKEKTKDKS